MCDINYVDVQFNSIHYNTLDNEINFILPKNIFNCTTKANVRTPVYFGSELKIKYFKSKLFNIGMVWSVLCGVFAMVEYGTYNSTNIFRLESLKYLRAFKKWDECKKIKKKISINAFWYLLLLLIERTYVCKPLCTKI